MNEIVNEYKEFLEGTPYNNIKELMDEESGSEIFPSVEDQEAEFTEIDLI